jgi:UDP-N-acetyl-D-mannosaminuronic acid dehydrogenase
VAKSHFVIIIIGTPVDEHLNPRYTLMKQFFVNLMDDIHDGQHIILRSTIYPGTTEKIRQLFLSHKKKVRLSFCPERVAQGQAVEEIHSLPQIIAGFDGESIEEARELFSSITDEIIVLEPLEAELAKLFTNVWRYIQFAIANQFYQLAVDNDVDFYKIYNAITYKYPRMKGIPGAGFAAGPCLFKDTMQLANYANNTFFLGHSSMLVNEGLPNFIVQKLKSKYALRDKTVGILGMAFKANNDDNRESLSYKLKKILEIEAKAVLCSDVYIREPDFVTAGFLIENADIIVLGTPHREYASLAISDDRILVDVWNFYGKGGLF